jgi:dTDP-glucose pyrophosphorylase
MIYGTIPAAGLGARLQPLGFSKELAIVGDHAVIEYLLERMVQAGIKKIFITIDPDKLDIPRYLSTKSPYKDNLVFVVNTKHSLTDDMFAPVRFLKDNDVLYFGLPDTIWYPKDGFDQLKKQKGDVVLGLFQSDHPENFGSVSTDEKNIIIKIEDKAPNPHSNWIWGIGKVTVKSAKTMLQLLPLSDVPNERLLSSALNLFKAKHPCLGIKIENSTYFDIGRKEDYKKATEFVEKHETLS